MNTKTKNENDFLIFLVIITHIQQKRNKNTFIN